MDDELLILGLLLGSSMHGYGLNEMTEQLRPYGVSVKPSTVYSRLERLERDGFVNSRTERIGKRPERRVYSLTKTGRHRLHQLVELNLGTHQRVAGPGDLGLLFAETLPVEVRRALLAHRLEHAIEDRDRLRLLAANDNPGQLAAGHALAIAEAEVNWLTAAAKRPARRRRAPKGSTSA